MAQATEKPGIGDFGFYLVVIFVASAAWWGQSYMMSLAHRDTLAQAPPDGIFGQANHVVELNKVQEKQLDAYLDVDRLLTTFGTTLLGALGFLLFTQQKAGTWTRHRWAVVLGVLFVAVSIFFGYVGHLFVLQELRDLQFFESSSLSVFDLTSSGPHWAQQAHFYTFLAGVVFLTDFVFHNLTKED